MVSSSTAKMRLFGVPFVALRRPRYCRRLGLLDEPERRGVESVAIWRVNGVGEREDAAGHDFGGAVQGQLPRRETMVVELSFFRRPGQLSVEEQQ